MGLPNQTAYRSRITTPDLRQSSTKWGQLESPSQGPKVDALARQRVYLRPVVRMSAVHESATQVPTVSLRQGQVGLHARVRPRPQRVRGDLLCRDVGSRRCRRVAATVAGRPRLQPLPALGAQLTWSKVALTVSATKIGWCRQAAPSFCQHQFPPPAGDGDTEGQLRRTHRPSRCLFNVGRFGCSCVTKGLGEVVGWCFQ